MKQVLERMFSALNVDPQLFKNMTNVSIAKVIKDFSSVFGRLVTQRNAKVSAVTRFKFSP